MESSVSCFQYNFAHSRYLELCKNSKSNILFLATNIEKQRYVKKNVKLKKILQETKQVLSTLH